MASSQKKPTHGARPGIIVRTFRMLFRVTLTIAVLALAGLAVDFGAQELARRADAAPPPEAAPVIPVSARSVAWQDGYAVRRAFVGQVEPQKTVSISFELPGQLASIAVDEGDWVDEGQELASQDISLLEAERTRLLASKTAAEAQLRFANQTVTRREELNKSGYSSQAGLDEAMSRRDELQARISEIDAALAAVDIRMGKSRISAPFEGRVTTRFVDGNETLNPGQAVLDMVALRRPQVRIGVPLDVTEATLATARIEIGSTVYHATLATLRPDIDPITRTRTAIFDLDTEAQPAFGQTARLVLSERVDARGLWVPLTTLKEGVRGQWTILTVDPERVVRSASVEILHAESDRAFVRAAFPDGTLLIDVGPQRVTVGQRVTAQIVE